MINIRNNRFFESAQSNRLSNDKIDQKYTLSQTCNIISCAITLGGATRYTLPSIFEGGGNKVPLRRTPDFIRRIFIRYAILKYTDESDLPFPTCFLIISFPENRMSSTHFDPSNNYAESTVTVVVNNSVTATTYPYDNCIQISPQSKITYLTLKLISADGDDITSDIISEDTEHFLNIGFQYEYYTEFDQS